MANFDSKTETTDSTIASGEKIVKTKHSMINFLNSLHGKFGDADPLNSKDWDQAGPPGTLCAHRVKRDIWCLNKEPLPGIFVYPEESNLFLVHCLIIGPFDTPYEGGFFHFVVRFGPSYPMHPPRVRILTTSHDKVRFNPNLYANGKVCLSILGTWSGPSWSPASNLSTVLLTLQSLLCEKPYHNEPGYESERRMGEAEEYNRLIQHETLRVSVCEQLEGGFLGPDILKDVMRNSFHDYYDGYVNICNKYMYLDGNQIVDPLYHTKGTYQFKNILQRLQKLKETIEVKENINIPQKENSDNIDYVDLFESDCSSDMESGDEATTDS